MGDKRPLPGTTPHEPQSGADLRLTLRGLLERIDNGDQSMVANLVHLLNALTGPRREEWEKRCPDAVLRCRLALQKLASHEAIEDAKLRLAMERLELDREKQRGETTTLPPCPTWGPPDDDSDDMAVE